jgi:preprotein translocase subunit YajC
METNSSILTAVIIGIVLLVYFMVKQNKKDRKKIEAELNFQQEADEVEINDDQN